MSAHDDYNPLAFFRTGFQTIDAAELLYKPLPKSSFLVEGLLPQGVNILCGSPKVGKSWLVLDLALKLATGEPIWDIETTKCDVLYLCLEDTYYYEVLFPAGIDFSPKRKNNARLLIFKKRDESDGGDGNDAI